VVKSISLGGVGVGGGAGVGVGVGADEDDEEELMLLLLLLLLFLSLLLLLLLLLLLWLLPTVSSTSMDWDGYASTSFGSAERTFRAIICPSALTPLSVRPHRLYLHVFLSSIRRSLSSVLKMWSSTVLPSSCDAKPAYVPPSYWTWNAMCL
jgi:hypothetical protein